ncbi:hemin receptor [Rhizobium vallis]|uniref:Hemin receptor n=1 Tax=Rhizobium vallis TaxID=634290 RepID=A0A432PFK2_9HYPH|nr:globin family protein [Rhizobium vallis]RUM22992.1 hemin receptor [Rhizobium vallis]
MEKETVATIQASFRKLVPIADKVGLIFYTRLFETHPSLRPMFAEDIAPQAKKLIHILGVVVGSLHALDAVMPAVKELARRHTGYGVTEAHYPVVGETLIWTLEQGLGDDFTDDVRQAWLSAYAALSGVMIAAANEPVQSGTIH